MGAVSKKILDRIIKETRKKSGINQLTSSQEDINWFRKIDEEERKTLGKADIEAFYPSIKERHIVESLNYIRNLSVQVSHLNITWTKKDSSFDNTMAVRMELRCVRSWACIYY